MKTFCVLWMLCWIGNSFAQSGPSPFIKLVEPYKTNNTTFQPRKYIIGSTCKSCSLNINDRPVKVYPTGAFAFQLDLQPGDTTLELEAISGGKSVHKKIAYTYTLPKKPVPVKTLDIESIETFPEGNLLLSPGDIIRFRVKALPGAVVKIMDSIPLYEMPVKQPGGMPGIYQGQYKVDVADEFSNLKIPVTVMDSSGKLMRRETKNSFSVLSPLASDIAITKGRLAHLEYGLGDDRLGGAKVGYLDSNIVLHITGKVGTHYRVQLAPNRIAYIPDEHVELLPRGSFEPESLTAKWNAYGDSTYDYVRVGLFARLPYQSFQELDPSRIIVDVFGATNNTNWITQFNTLKEIKNLYYEQKGDQIFRITIELKHPQFWGHSIYYEGNTLVIKVKQQPAELSLKKLVVAVDAGHGGSNEGAVGPTGVYEKELTLAVSLKLKKLLEREGAKVIMTRETEKFFDNKERILFYRDSLPDLLLSLHLNSSEDPIRVGGTSTFYRYPGFRPFSHAIYNRMLELGLKEYGNTGSFNFMLNSPIEYPNALVEMLFLSNPEEEMKILDPLFQQQVAEKIVQGTKDFLESCREKKER